MRFKAEKAISKVLKAALAFSLAEFKIIGDISPDQKQIILSFINSAQDFKLADKYVEGAEWNYTNEHGISQRLNMQNFGPYRRKLITEDDITKTTFMELHQSVIKIVSEEIGEEYKDQEYEDYLDVVEKYLSSIDTIGLKYYRLTPPDNKIALLHPFTLYSYLCFFCIDQKSKNLRVLQVDDS